MWRDGTLWKLGNLTTPHDSKGLLSVKNMELGATYLSSK